MRGSPGEGRARRARPSSSLSPRLGQRDAQGIVPIAFANSIHGAMEQLAVVEKRELFVAGPEARETDPEQSNGRPTLSRALEQIVDHRIELELRASGCDGARTLERLE